jgi:hypothetical protein
VWLVVAPQFGTLLRRHLAAVAVVLVLAAGLAFRLKSANQGYEDSATVSVYAPRAVGDPFSDAQSLLAMNELMAYTVMGAQGQQQVRGAGGTGSYDVSMVNLNNEDFPDYADPYVTVTATSPSAAEAQGTFSAVLKVLSADLQAIQARQGARPDYRIQLAPIAAPTGPVPQQGSSVRVLAGLAGLTLIAILMTAGLLDRFPLRPPPLLRRHHKPTPEGLRGREVGLAAVRPDQYRPAT